MRLRTRISEELAARLADKLPNAMETVWDTSAVLVMVENLSFKPASGFEGDWMHRVSFEGMIRTELKADQSDDLGDGLLIASLLTEPLIVALPDISDPEPEIDDAHPKPALF